MTLSKERRIDRVVLGLDTEAPTAPTTAITVSDITPTGFTISWENATDNQTAADRILYKVCGPSCRKGPVDGLLRGNRRNLRPFPLPQRRYPPSVEHDLAKVGVASSSLVFRSKRPALLRGVFLVVGRLVCPARLVYKSRLYKKTSAERFSLVQVSWI